MDDRLLSALPNEGVVGDLTGEKFAEKKQAVAFAAWLLDECGDLCAQDGDIQSQQYYLPFAHLSWWMGRMHS